MKRIICSLIAASAMLTLYSCETTSASSGSSGSAAPVKPYPLSTCLVTGEGLSSKGTPITMVHQGQEVKVCCKACQFAFKKNPEVFLAKIQ